MQREQTTRRQCCWRACQGGAACRQRTDDTARRGLWWQWPLGCSRRRTVEAPALSPGYANFEPNDRRLMQMKGIPITPNSVCRWSRRIWWSPVSKAADRSRPMSTVTCVGHMGNYFTLSSVGFISEYTRYEGDISCSTLVTQHFGQLVPILFYWAVIDHRAPQIG